ncbi:MAG: hypothetical protein NTU48_00275 [Legionellales bacterium]|nr:hypothetical protein [Legionellales bacterium]
MILCVDLDGTLIKTDTTWLAVEQFLRKNPLHCWRLLVWLLHGRAYLKQQLGQAVQLDPSTLPYHKELIQWLIERQQNGDTLVLATATDQIFAQSVAKYLGIFTQVIASDGRHNLRAKYKAAALTSQFGLKGYSYVGNSWDDLAVWRESRTAIVVNASKRLERRVRKIADVVRVFDGKF